MGVKSSYQKMIVAGLSAALCLQPLSHVSAQHALAPKHKKYSAENVGKLFRALTRSVDGSQEFLEQIVDVLVKKFPDAREFAYIASMAPDWACVIKSWDVEDQNAQKEFLEWLDRKRPERLRIVLEAMSYLGKTHATRYIKPLNIENKIVYLMRHGLSASDVLQWVWVVAQSGPIIVHTGLGPYVVEAKVHGCKGVLALAAVSALRDEIKSRWMFRVWLKWSQALLNQDNGWKEKLSASLTSLSPLSPDKSEAMQLVFAEKRATLEKLRKSGVLGFSPATEGRQRAMVVLLVRRFGLEEPAVQQIVEAETLAFHLSGASHTTPLGEWDNIIERNTQKQIAGAFGRMADGQSLSPVYFYDIGKDAMMSANKTMPFPALLRLPGTTQFFNTSFANGQAIEWEDNLRRMLRSQGSVREIEETMRGFARHGQFAFGLLLLIRWANLSPEEQMRTDSPAVADERCAINMLKALGWLLLYRPLPADFLAGTQGYYIRRATVDVALRYGSILPQYLDLAIPVLQAMGEYHVGSMGFLLDDKRSAIRAAAWRHLARVQDDVFLRVWEQEAADDDTEVRRAVLDVMSIIAKTSQDQEYVHKAEQVYRRILLQYMETVFGARDIAFQEWMAHPEIARTEKEIEDIRRVVGAMPEKELIAWSRQYPRLAKDIRMVLSGPRAVLNSLNAKGRTNLTAEDMQELRIFFKQEHREDLLAHLPAFLGLIAAGEASAADAVRLAAAALREDLGGILPEATRMKGMAAKPEIHSVQEKLALDLVEEMSASFKPLLENKQLVSIAGQVFEKPEALFEALNGKEFTLGAEDKVRLNYDMVSGLKKINARDPAEIKKLTRMSQKEWQVFLWALYCRSLLDFDESTAPGAIPSSVKTAALEAYRRLALARMMQYIFAAAQSMTLTWSDMPRFRPWLRDYEPWERELERAKSLPKGLERYRSYMVSLEPLTGSKFRMPLINLPAGDVGRTMNLSEIHPANHEHALGLVNNTGELDSFVALAKTVYRNKGASPADRRAAALALANHVPQEEIPSLLKDLVNMALREESLMVRMGALTGLTLTMRPRENPSQDMIREVAKLSELALRDKEEGNLMQQVLNMTDVMHPLAAREILIAFAIHKDPKIRVQALGKLTLIPDAHVLEGLIKAARLETDARIQKEIMAQADAMFSNFGTDDLFDVLDSDQAALRKSAVERLAKYPSEKTVEGLAEAAMDDKDEEVREAAKSALIRMAASMPVETLDIRLRARVLNIHDLPRDLHERLIESPWRFKTANEVLYVAGHLKYLNDADKGVVAGHLEEQIPQFDVFEFFQWGRALKNLRKKSNLLESAA